MTASAIRPISPKDLPDLLAFQRETHAEHQSRQPDHFGPADDFNRWSRWLIAAANQRKIEGSTAVCFVWDEGNGPIGYVCLAQHNQIKAQNAHDRTVDIMDIFVRSDHRRQGLGTALLDAALNWAQSTGTTLIQAVVWCPNIASTKLFAGAAIPAAAALHAKRLANTIPHAAPVRNDMRLIKWGWKHRLGYGFNMLCIAGLIAFAMLAFLTR
ncbi:GNAT family N-acetyltransferase [Neogemmobacter tilapiae]|uniref:GNAT family N-acetyltransferase n=1 Tax=Neogemmobacter tilapiae TaxID=875041 RepID=UPI00167829F5|nr:GNAT family N-acetyltransferase [Gemmobacter tilapiae]